MSPIIDTLLGSLRVIAEAGVIADPRCAEALDLLESKRFPDGGFPAEIKHYTTAPSSAGRMPSGFSRVKWGDTGANRANAWVTVEALAILAAAGRLP